MKIVPILTFLLLAAAPVGAQGAFLGVQVGPADEGGVRLESVNPDTAAEIMGLKLGDRLLSLDGEAVDGVDAFVQRIGQRLPGEIIRLDLVRGGETLSLRGVLGRRPGLQGLRGPALPGQRGLPQRMEVPDLPEGWTLEIPDGELPQFLVPPGYPEELQGLLPDHDSPMGSIRERLLELQGGAWLDRGYLGDLGELRGFRFLTEDGPGGLRILGLDQAAEREVHVRYPASTPEEDREGLIRDARRKYGEDAEVAFEGEGTSISIVTRSRSGAAEDSSRDLLDRLRRAEGDDEEVVEEVVEAPARLDAEVHPGWHAGLEQALAAARKSGKPVLIDFSADWCGPCRQLGAQLLHNPEHAALIQRFEPVQIDVDRNGELARKFEVGGIPDLRILRPDGEQVHKVVGFGGVDAAIRQLQAGLERASGPGDEPDPKLEKLKEHREQLQRELEEARRQLDELRKEVGGGESSSSS
ncbi:MAG: thioredoxin family protein [Planctomycetes bacterium]|nr:thioredoxin family protein [Planctomycetota bacterium]